MTDEIKEKHLSRLKRARLLDDTFMRKFFEGDNERVEYVLRTILGRDDLTVQEVHTQDSKDNILYRSVILDILATGKDGETYNIEIQRSDDGAGFRRTRYHRSMIDVSLIDKGKQFEELPEVYIIFITEKDVIGGEKPIYTLEKQLKYENHAYPFDDGEHIVYVNGAYRQVDTPLGQLIHDFNCSNPREMFSELLKEKALYYKEGKAGIEIMCRLWEEAKQEGIAEGLQKGMEQGIEQGIEKGMEQGMEKGKREAVKLLVQDRQYSIEKIAEMFGLTVEEVKKLQNEKQS